MRKDHQTGENPQVVTCAQMKEIERRAAEGGLSYYQMMENAGTGAAKFIMDKIPVKGRQVYVFCGKGNNGEMALWQGGFCIKTARKWRWF